MFSTNLKLCCSVMDLPDDINQLMYVENNTLINSVDEHLPGRTKKKI